MMIIKYYVNLQNLLYNELISFRGELAHELGLAPFMVGSNRLLGELSRTRYIRPLHDLILSLPLVIIITKGLHQRAHKRGRGHV